MRRFACLLVAVGCVLLALTVIGATRPDRAPARALHPVGAMHVPTALRQAMRRFLRGIGGAPVIVGHPRPRFKTATVPRSSGRTCTVGAVHCSVHPCLVYTGQTSATVLQLYSVVAARGRRPGRAVTASGGGAQRPARSCRHAQPDYAAVHVSG